MTSYIYDIKRWNPINTKSFNLLVNLQIVPDIKLLELFKLAPLHNILCKISETNSEYDNKITYGKIDKSTEDETYYITLDKVWKSYPDLNKLGKIEFLADTVYQTINYITNPDASPIIKTDNELPTLNLLYNDSTNKVGQQALPNAMPNALPNALSGQQQLASSSPFSLSTAPQFCSNPRMKLSDMLIPIGLSLVIIGLLTYMFPKKLFN